VDKIEAFKLVEGFLPLGEGGLVYEAWQTLKIAVLAQQTTNKPSDEICPYCNGEKMIKNQHGCPSWGCTYCGATGKRSHVG
jgi:hypothetical protein